MGKPQASFFRSALEELHVDDAKKAVMIGDDVVQDVSGAVVEAGLGTGILVKTGKYLPGDEEKAPQGTIVVNSIVEAVDHILLAMKNTVAA
jgi:ribonucleotide monophosphatase NagD (HAD superfamily)